MVYRPQLRITKTNQLLDELQVNWDYMYHFCQAREKRQLLPSVGIAVVTTADFFFHLKS